MSILDQSIHLENESIAPPKERTGEMIKLLLIYFLDRAAYYGLRSIIVLYLVNVFHGENETPYYLYGLFTGCVYLVSAFSGVIGDFVLGTKNTIFAGLLISGFAAISFAIFGDTYLYYSLFIFAIGSGIVRPNLLSQTAKSFFETRKGLGKIFMIIYMAINFGAFIGVILILWLYEIYGYPTAFITVGVLSIGAGIITMLGEFHEPSKSEYIDHRKKERSSKNLLILLIPFLGVALFWFLYELGYFQFIATISAPLDQLFGDYPATTSSQLINVISIALFVTVYLLFKNKISATFSKMIGFGLLISTFTWILIFILNFIMSDTLNAYGYALVLILFCLTELLINPIILAMIGWRVPNQLLGTAYSIYLLMTFLLTRLASFLSEFTQLAKLLVFVSIGVITLLGIGILYLPRLFPKEHTAPEIEDPI